MGVATTRLDERLLASLGQLGAGAPIRFEPVSDVPNGGVLCALPALLEVGLLRHQKSFSLPPGFYSLPSIFLLIAYLALARVKSIDAVRYEPPGEWGKLMGLDRIPEVRTLREKIHRLCHPGEQVFQWSSTLSQEWMQADPDSAGCLYIDGHIRVYHGTLTQLPKRYVSRQRLCLRGTTDYWVNAMDGQPFFVVTQPVDPGLRHVLEQKIVPQLLKDIPGQPTQAELEANPLRARFVVIFDREGYSAELFLRMWQQRVAVTSYRKFVDKEDYWPLDEFTLREVKLVNGEPVSLWLAERGVLLSKTIWMREIRRRDPVTGHQTSIISTDFLRPLEEVAAAMFARWCQENFFRYMSEHYSLNSLAEYGTEPVPDTVKVVNPAWKRKDQQFRREKALLLKEQARFAGLETPSQPEALSRFELQKGKLLEAIQHRQQALEQIKTERKAITKRVLMSELPPEERFTQLRPAQKHFVDTIKLIAYRAETALVHIVREKLGRDGDARALVRQVLTSTADFCPEQDQNILRVRLHPLSTAAHNEVLQHLCAALNDTETEYPGTNLRLVFEQIGATPIP